MGIVADVQHNALDEEVKSTFYVPFAQQIQLGHTLLIRTSIESGDVLPQIRDRIHSLDGLLPINVDGTMQELIAQSTAEERYRTFLLAVFGLCATALAAVGIFGVTARGVTQRSHELGLRLALGARQAELVRMVMRQEMIALVIGAVAGLFGAVVASDFLERFLFTVDSRDPLTYVVATGFLVTLGLLTSYLPARRMAKLDPTRVLRAE